MKNSRNTTLLLMSAALGTLAVALTAATWSQEPPVKQQESARQEKLIPSLKGADLFHHHCASCHGAEGKGTGPAAPALNTPLPNLTTLAKRNGGIFPARRVQNIISGTDTVIAHGSREMPVWGPIFHQVEYDRDFGAVRLENVTKYIESIQQK